LAAHLKYKMGNRTIAQPIEKATLQR